jgi:hypothetical protein
LPLPGRGEEKGLTGYGRIVWQAAAKIINLGEAASKKKIYDQQGC